MTYIYYRHSALQHFLLKPPFYPPSMVTLSMYSRSPIPSIRSIFRSHGSSSRDPSPSTVVAAIERLPSNIVTRIGCLSALCDVLHLSLCSRRLRLALAPVLYSSIELKTNRQCKTTLIALSKQPEHAAMVRRLVVRVNCLEWTLDGEEIDEDLIAGLIGRMATKLCSLEEFVWDGLEMPEDDIWLVLRNSCKYLKRISTSVGEEPMNAASHLFDFDDLRQFALNVKCHSLEWLAEGLPKVEKLPRRFWEMLIERCPRLQDLALGGPAPCPRVFDIRHITAGKWSRLHSLSLGDTLLISSSHGEHQSRKDWEAFMTFFAWHKSLRSLHLRHAPGSVNFPAAFALPPSALPNLITFSGPVKFVKTLPHPELIQDLSLTTLHHTPSSFPATFALLQDLPSISSLRIWIDLSFGIGSRVATTTSPAHSYSQGSFDEAHVFRSLLSVSGPQLQNLDVLCFTRPAFAIKEFSAALVTAPNLRSFSLTKVFKSTDEDMTRSASRIITENPHLHRFSIRHTHDSWFSAAGGRLKQTATFEVLKATPVMDCADQPPGSVSLLVHELGRGGLTGKEYSKHFIHSVVILKDSNSINGKPIVRRSRRRSELSTTSSGSWSVGSGLSAWSWGSAGEQCSSGRSSISSDTLSREGSWASRRASIKLTGGYVLA